MHSRHPDFRAPDAASEARIDALIAQLTLDEKIAMLAGSQQDKVDNGNTVPCPRLGIPSLRLADASLGVHWWAEDSTTFPATIALAATFDAELGYRYGEAIGRECRARGIHILLGPGVNIYRSALCGRNFEYLGEDPVLTATLVCGYVRGLQDQRVAATVKHYAVNFEEYERHRISSDVDERTLREVYLPSFEAAVRDAGAAAIMTAYNRVNGAWCAEHRFLLKDVLKGEWGFDGLVMSDWVSVYDTVNSANHGLDLEMPKAKWFAPERLRPAVANGLVPVGVIDDKIRRLLRLMLAFGWMDGKQQDSRIPLHDESSAAVALEVARDSIVLLKNDGILPLDSARAALPKCIAVIGPCGHPAVIGGGGSAGNKPWRSTSIYEGLKAALPQVEVVQIRGVDPWRSEQAFQQAEFLTPDGAPGIRIDYFANETLSGTPMFSRVDPRINGRFTAAELPGGVDPQNFSALYQGAIRTTIPGPHALKVECWHGALRLILDGVCLLDSWTAEMMGDRDLVVDLAPGDHALRLEYHGMRERSYLRVGYEHVSAMRTEFDQAIDLAKSADLVVFCGGHTDKSEGEARDRSFAMHAEIERLLLAVTAVNPNTIAVITAGGNIDMESWHDRVRALVFAWYPGQEGGTAVADILTGKVNPSGRLPATFERRLEDRSSHGCYHDPDRDLRVMLSDGVFGGYRHHDRTGIAPRYAFGQGLSYTTFAYENLSVSSGDTLPVTVSCDVVNTGTQAGKAVALVFVGARQPSLPRPVKELKGFAKVALAPGERKRVSISLDRRAFAYFDVGRHAWVVDPGAYAISVGAAADDVRIVAAVMVGAAVVPV